MEVEITHGSPDKIDTERRDDADEIDQRSQTKQNFYIREISNLRESYDQSMRSSINQLD